MDKSVYIVVKQLDYSNVEVFGVYDDYEKAETAIQIGNKANGYPCFGKKEFLLNSCEEVRK